MDEPINRGGCRHLVPENPLPVTEHEVACDQDRAPLVALGE
jgi:hypothetical protein